MFIHINLFDGQQCEEFMFLFSSVFYISNRGVFQIKYFTCTNIPVDNLTSSRVKMGEDVSDVIFSISNTT